MFAAPSWSFRIWEEPRAPSRTLHLCRNSTQACQGAASQGARGFAVHVWEADGITRLMHGQASIFGPVVRSRFPGSGEATQLVMDTLDAGQMDVWFSSSDPSLLDEVFDQASQKGHRVIREAPSQLPRLAEPFKVFSIIVVRPMAGVSGGVPNYCMVDPAVHLPLAVGDEIRMACEGLPGGGTRIAYVDPEGFLVGLHGTLPVEIGAEDRRMLSRVRSSVTFVSWGREFLGDVLRDVQTIAFDLPPDVDLLVAGATLKRGT